MQESHIPVRQPRTHYRHELRTLTYVVLDAANGGIVRNLSHEGVAVQAVAPLRQQQRVRLRFELRFPRLRVDAYGEVSWTNPSGQCGIRFVDLPARTGNQINEWIFSNLLDVAAREVTDPHSIFGAATAATRDENVSTKNDGLTLSPSARPAIRLEPSFTRRDAALVPDLYSQEDRADRTYPAHAQLTWLSRPVKARTLGWLVDSLVIVAALLLFALIFISIAHELPPWRLTLGAALLAAVSVAAAYRALFALVGGPSLGARLALAASGIEEKEENGNEGRFR
jgi:hypothetical protein